MHDESGPLGFLGGSFDPVHIGHLRGAMAVREALNLLRVDLVPAGAIAAEARGDANGVSSPCDAGACNRRCAGLGRRCASSTAPVHRSLSIPWRHCVRSTAGRAPWYGLLVRTVSSPCLAGLRWRELLSLAHVAVLDRPGSAMPSEEVTNWLGQHRIESPELSLRPAGGVVMLRQPLLDIASSQIRGIFASGNSPRFLLPDAVMEYIERNALFGPGKS